MTVKKLDRQRVLTAAGHVLVLMGGESTEREISLLSGNAVFESLQRSGVRASKIDVGADFIPSIRALKPDFVLNMLHGEVGEDGIMQGFLEVMGVPYSGSGVLASALAMDKIRAKRLWLQRGLATPDFELLSDSTDWESVAARLGVCVVKPVSGGSSLGIAKAQGAAQIQDAYYAALEEGAEVMAEACVVGAEYTVGILGDVVLPSIELAAQGKLFGYDEKYIRDDIHHSCPAALSRAESAALNALCVAAYDALGCKGTARVDVMRDGAGEFTLLEINTLPGMTSHSFVPQAAAAMGIDFDELVLRIIEQGLAGVSHEG